MGTFPAGTLFFSVNKKSIKGCPLGNVPYYGWKGAAAGLLNSY
jgi:hypothetical protein